MTITGGIARAINRLRYPGAETNRVVRQETKIDSVTTQEVFFPDLEPWVAPIIEKASPYTLTSPERMSALCHAVRFVVRRNIPGGIVECGVGCGGSSMVAAWALLAEGDVSRTLHLFDTFEGMPPPTELDRETQAGRLVSGPAQLDIKLLNWRFPGLEEVRQNLALTGYPPDRIRYVKGRVEDTIPTEAPTEIAILRLDTDWYESTRHELIHLYPRLSRRGVLIIDDYGHFEGARKAVDEYVEDNRLPIFLNRIDYTGRLAVKDEDPIISNKVARDYL
jgi:O-methyltransferase